MTHKANTVAILQFNERIVMRLAASCTDGTIRVQAFDRRLGAWNAQDGSLRDALKAFCDEFHVNECPVYTILPRHEMTARLLVLPSHDMQELDNMVRLGAEDYVPFSVEELVVETCVLEQRPDGHSSVLAVFAHRDVVNSHLELLREAGIEPVQVFLSTACLASAAMGSGLVGPISKSDRPDREDRASEPERGPAALVDLAAGGLEVLVMKDGRLEFNRAVASTQDWHLAETDGGEVLEELAVEVRASLMTYRRESEDGQGVDKVYLCSDWADVSAPLDTLSHELGLDCAAARLGERLVGQGRELLEGTTPLASLGGVLLAAEQGAVEVRLLPRAVVQARQHSALRQEVRKFALLAAALLVTLGTLYAQAVFQRRAYIRDLERRIAEIQPLAEGVVAKQRQLRILQNQVERSGGVIELLADLCDVFPSSEMNITRFVFLHGQKIDLYGRAKSLQQIEKLVQDLIQIGKASMPQFAMAKQVYEQTVTERNEQVRDFRIELPFPQAEERSNGEDSEESDE